MTQGQHPEAKLAQPALVKFDKGGYDSKVSSLNAVTRALQARGVLFTRDGVGIAQKMDWPNGKPADPVIRRRVVAGLNTARAARGDPLLIDSEDD
jgi:hypothetical protein